jgi:hypothetical protein
MGCLSASTVVRRLSYSGTRAERPGTCTSSASPLDDLAAHRLPAVHHTTRYQQQYQLTA